MLLLRMIARQVASRPLRALLTFCSIALGVASIVAVQITVATAREGFEGLTRTGTSSVALEVVGDQERPFDATLVNQVRSVPGVTDAVPVLQRPAFMHTRGRSVALYVVGLDLADPNALADYDLRTGREIHGSGEALLEVSLARALDIEPGEKVKLLTHRGMRTCVVVGLLAPRSVGAGQGGFLFAPLQEVQNWFREEGQCNRIEVLLTPQANLEEVQAQLSKRLPADMFVRIPPARSRMAEGALRPALQALSFCSALAFVMAAFIILNSFLMTVSERRRMISTMRALGTTRGQIIRLLLGEGLILGVLGTGLGFGLGLGAARLLRNVLEQLVWGTLPPLQVGSEPFLLAGLLGPGVSLLGTFLPARWASMVSPLEGIRGLVPQEKPPSMRWYLLSGLGLGLIASAFMICCIQSWLPISFAAPGAVLGVVAAVLLLPPVLPTLERLVAGLVTPWLRYEARLAHVTILRYQVRSALTVGVLFVALCTGFAMGNTVTDHVQDVQNWAKRTIQSDALIRAYRPNGGTETTPDIPTGLEQRVRQVPGVVRVEAVRLFRVEAAGEDSNLIVREFPDPSNLQLDLKEGQPREVYRGLLAGGAVLSTMLAEHTHLRVGDTIEVETSSAKHPMPIVGVCSDYTLGGMSLYVARPAAERLFGVHGSDILLIRFDPARTAEAWKQVRQLAAENGLLAQSFTEFTQMIDNMMNGSTALIWGVLVLGFLVAALGIANTLSMNVLEQTREIGLMRAAGMTGGQILRMVLYQALLMALIGLPLGVLGGIFLAWVISLCVLPLIGHSVPFQLHLPLLGGCFGAALLIVVVTAWLPARRAQRTPVLEAIHTE